MTRASAGNGPTLAGADRADHGRTAAHFEMLASALAGRALAVVDADIDGPYTDGRTIYLPRGIDSDRSVAAVAAHACMVGAGSLDRETARRLAAHGRGVHSRYLLLEAIRLTRPGAVMGMASAPVPPRARAMLESAYEGRHADSERPVVPPGGQRRHRGAIERRHGPP